MTVIPVEGRVIGLLFGYRIVDWIIRGLYPFRDSEHLQKPCLLTELLEILVRD
jgi:hypothetical protein